MEKTSCASLASLSPLFPYGPLKQLVTNFSTENFVLSSCWKLDIEIVFPFDFLGFQEKNKKPQKLAFAIGKTEENCDVFSGKWVRDEVSRPPYEEWECPYIQPQLTCQEHGRPDKDYQFWRWQPNHCDLPS